MMQHSKEQRRGPLGGPKSAPSGAVTKPYEPVPCELEALEAQRDRRNRRKPSPRIKLTDKRGVVQIDTDHQDPAVGPALLMEALRTSEVDFLNGLIRQLVNVGAQGSTGDEHGLNFLLAMVKGIEPKDQVETMLAAQMAAVHNATMTFARRLNNVDNIPQQDSAERAFNKLARTFAAQVEALKRYRTGGQQRVIVEHVTVNSGGQAIVGSVAVPGGGVQPKPEDQPHALNYAPGVAMPSTVKAEREAVPVASRQRA
jgi:hypothetical protein